MQVGIPVALPPGTKLLRLSYLTESNSYVLWIHHDKTFQYGTYLTLHPDGKIERVTQRPDGTEERHRVS